MLDKKAILEALKSQFPNMKFTARVKSVGYTDKLVISVNSPEVVKECMSRQLRMPINSKHLQDRYDNLVRDIKEGLTTVTPYGDPKLPLLSTIEAVMKKASNYYDNSDPMTDYFDVSFYYSFAIKAPKDFTFPTLEELRVGYVIA